MKISYENTECTRCGGTGKHSWCQQYQDQCFQCGGQGRQLTKRGLAALKYVNSLRNFKVADITVGMKTRRHGTITDITVDAVNGGHKIYTDHPTLTYCHITEGGTIEMALNAEMITKANDYQSKLTKAGKLMKKHEGEF